MQWWAWIAVGSILLGSELAFVDAQFYLVFVGLAAIVVGFLDLGGWLPALGIQWSVFAVLALTFMFGFRRQIYDRIRRGLPVMRGGPVGEVVLLEAALPPGESCRVEFRGSSWSVVNRGESVIPAGACARIERVDGLTLVVQCVANP